MLSFCLKLAILLGIVGVSPILYEYKVTIDGSASKYLEIGDVLLLEASQSSTGSVLSSWTCIYLGNASGEHRVYSKINLITNSESAVLKGKIIESGWRNVLTADVRSVQSVDMPDNSSNKVPFTGSVPAPKF